jgi:hypothetical protein
VIEAFRTINKKLTWGLMACLVVYAIVRSVAAAAGKPFWYDELLTLAVSSLSGWEARLTALKLPLDGQPPLFYSIEHLLRGLLQNEQVAMRLPSILALPCTLVCIFVYVRRRRGEVLAFFCALLLLITSLFQTYAVEARPYSMVAACIAFALVCYQRTPTPLWTALFAMSLALAESLHYLSVVAMVPFGLAEAILLLRTRRNRWPVWGALVTGTVPLLLQWKLLAINKAYYGPHFWAHFRFSELPRTYGEFFLVHGPIGGGIAAVCLAAIVGTYLCPRCDGADELHSAEGAVEAMLLLGFVALPVIAYLLVTVVLHSGLTSRYVISTILGLVMTIGFALSRATWKTVALFGVFVFAAVGVQELSFWRSIRGVIREATDSAAGVEAFVSHAGHTELPVAVANYSVYLPLAHSCARSFVERLVFLAETPNPGHEDLPTDTVNKGMALLQMYWPIRMSHFQEFTATHKEFLVYVEDREPGGDWFVLRLSQEGWSIQTVALENYRMVYLASSRGRSVTQ